METPTPRRILRELMADATPAEIRRVASVLGHLVRLGCVPRPAYVGPYAVYDPHDPVLRMVRAGLSVDEVRVALGVRNAAAEPAPTRPDVPYVYAADVARLLRSGLRVRHGYATPSGSRYVPCVEWDGETPAGYWIDTPDGSTVPVAERAVTDMCLSRTIRRAGRCYVWNWPSVTPRAAWHPLITEVTP